MMDPAFVDMLVGALAFERVAEALDRDVPDAPRVPDSTELHTAVAVAAASTLRRTADGTGDLYSQRVGPSAVALLFGIDPETLLHHRLGTPAAPSAGRDPGAFPTDLDRGLLGPVDRPGKGIEVVAGIGLALRLRGESRVVLHVDDAAGTASGDWHEGFNFAAVSAAPLVQLLHTRDGGNDPHAALGRLAAKAPAYGVSTASAPAHDLPAVIRAVSDAVERARAGGGTVLVEIVHDASGEGASRDPAAALGLARAEFEARIVSRVEEFGPMAARVRDAAPSGDALDVLAPSDPRVLPWYRTPELRPR